MGNHIENIELRIRQLYAAIAKKANNKWEDRSGLNSIESLEETLLINQLLLSCLTCGDPIHFTSGYQYNIGGKMVLVSRYADFLSEAQS